MELGFWRDLPRPIIGLSPMDGVTDQPYRHIFKKYGCPDVIMTEFTSVEGLARNAIKLFKDFIYDESQRPIVAQLFGKEPESFRTAALIAAYLGFDGVDINMGCPAKNVRQSGSGAALIENPKLAKEIILATKAGLQDWAEGEKIENILSLKQKTIKLILEKHSQLPHQYQKRRLLPVSVKTRIGYEHSTVSTWIPTLLETKPAVISLHGRTLKQMYTGSADWEEIAKAGKIVHQTSNETLILGNGDIVSVDSAKEKITTSGIDGILIGRATFGNPWVLAELTDWRNGVLEKENRGNLPKQASSIPNQIKPNLQDKIRLAIEHCQVYETFLPEDSFQSMRKHLAWYIKGFPQASDIRVQLMQANNASQVEKILNQIDP